MVVEAQDFQCLYGIVSLVRGIIPTKVGDVLE